MARMAAARKAAATPRAVEFDDLFGAACLALCGAARRYEPGRGVPFGAFANRCIMGGMRDAIRGQDWLSRTHRINATAVDEAMQLCTDEGWEPTASRLMGLTDLSERQARTARSSGN